MIYKIKNICCIGAGYVGGPTMAVIADRCQDLEINVVDLNQDRIDNWNNKDLTKLPVYEPGLKQIIQRCRGKNLHFSTMVEEHIKSADMIFISVNTPTKTSGIGAGKASDLKWIEASARQIAKFAKNKTIVVEKSTLPVKTANTIKKILEAAKLKNKESSKEIQEFTVLSNPEFLSEGTAINDLENPDRILIGGDDQNSINSLKEIYLNWVDSNKILTTNIWSSELSKLTANAFLAQRISSINSISALCEATGADVQEVSLGIGMDSRIGHKFLRSGPGFGGSCFKKDILNLIYICDFYGLKEVSSYWKQVIEINDWQKKRISKIIVEKLFGTVSGKKIGILGFAFKSNTNDTRDSPAINICKDLLDEGANIHIYDPKVNLEKIEEELKIPQIICKGNDYNEGSWHFSYSIKNTAIDSDALIILTEWDEFKNLDWKTLSEIMRSPSWLFDTRSITNIKEAKKNGINTWVIGKGND